MSNDTSAADAELRILLIEDHAMIRDGLRMMLSLHRKLRVVGEAATAAEGRARAAALKPDLAIIDVGLPDADGIGLAAELMAAQPDLRALILTGETDPATVTRALAAGAHGYVPKHYDADELFRAIATLASGGRYVSRTLAQVWQPPASRPSAAQEALGVLTEREREVVTLLCAGDSSKVIARKLDLSVATVRKHRENILGKREVHNLAEVIAIALRGRNG